MWTDDKFEKEILKSMQVLCIDRMPSRSVSSPGIVIIRTFPSLSSIVVRFVL